ncbi:MAG: 2-dehydropantoate 2-reductase [Kofleriaceae bacterium]
MTRIAVFGAGAIGCWVGGTLAAGGADVTLIARQRIVDELAGGLTISELAGGARTVPLGERLRVTTDPTSLVSAEVILVTVKSTQTSTAGGELARVLPDDAVVTSFQNGVRNAEVLRAALPRCRVLAAMVPWNVVRRDRGAYHRASSGVLRIDDDPAAAPLVAACRAAGLAIEPRTDMLAVQWAKLVMNLNNAINALSGLPLKTELGQRPYRRCLAAAQREALDLLAVARQDVAKLTALPPRWMPGLLRVPDRVFGLLAGKIVAIDPTARSSMWDDLQAGRPTEIDFLQGEVVALAERLGRAAPINRALVQLVRAAETGGKREYTGSELSVALGL